MTNTKKRHDGQKAKENQVRKPDLVSQNSVEQKAKAVDTQKELAIAAGVSHDTPGMILIEVPTTCAKQILDAFQLAEIAEQLKTKANDIGEPLSDGIADVHCTLLEIFDNAWTQAGLAVRLASWPTREDGR